jgi:hypothetical protein
MLIPPSQRRCQNCVACVEDAFANGRGLASAIGRLGRCSKCDSDRARPRLSPNARCGSAPTNNTSVPAFDPCPGFNTAAFEAPFAILASSPAFNPAPTSFAPGPTFGPASIPCVVAPTGAGLVAPSDPPTDFNLATYVSSTLPTYGSATVAPSYPAPVAFTSAPINPLGADGYVTGPIITCAAYSPDGNPPGYTPGSGSGFAGGSAQGGYNGGSAGTPRRSTTVNPQDLVLPNDISRTTTGSQLVIPSGKPLTGLGCFSERTDSRWQCQHLSERLTSDGRTLHIVCGQYCESERALIDHYNGTHGPVNILLPGFWHPCVNCDAFNEDYSRCLSCGREAIAADSRWVCASVGRGPTPPGHVIIGLRPPGPNNPDDEIFAGLAPELYNLFGFPSMLYSTLRPIFSTVDVFSRTFYACLEDASRFLDVDAEGDDDVFSSDEE